MDENSLEQQQNFILYASNDKNEPVKVRVVDETIWVSQSQMAEIFGVTTPTINEHLKNIFKEGELNNDSVIRKFRITTSDLKQYRTLTMNQILIKQQKKY